MEVRRCDIPGQDIQVGGYVCVHVYIYAYIYYLHNILYTYIDKRYVYICIYIYIYGLSIICI